MKKLFILGGMMLAMSATISAQTSETATTKTIAKTEKKSCSKNATSEEGKKACCKKKTSCAKKEEAIKEEEKQYFLNLFKKQLSETDNCFFVLHSFCN